MEKLFKTSLIAMGTAAAITAFLVFMNQEEKDGLTLENGDSNSNSSDEYTTSNSHELSSDSTEDDNSNGTVSSPRTLSDYLKILKHDDNSDVYVMKKLESTQVLLTISAYSESYPLLEQLDVIGIVLENMNYILAQSVTSPNQDSLLIKLGLFLGNLLSSKNSQLKVIDARFVPTLLSLINDTNEVRADFALLCLQNLSLNEEGAEEIVISQGVPSYVTLLNDASKPIGLKKQALYSILNLCLINRVKSMIYENQELRVTLDTIGSGTSPDLSRLTSRILILLSQPDDEE
ncbi:hypothetical protein SAMD00019534_121590 [Acytostelium subglobosum LB1]|uniref:hypothetical protein n=1 Tax=Acytostelium subglobosum LB1 TaxID=1410327 RepID=UPI0006450C58|nr:hypothetical protein SAMD00019534_121590 [Acytostelium subglobosum LB1]GAM28983.1 hypothetical protein SAMD00019534_121590 [Acytostelium subglobosum LB1]|eukprot:XP_012747989.1 hypothetical protein SAMD00019534_121590 [Acytostelium subglobosum LB1]